MRDGDRGMLAWGLYRASQGIIAPADSSAMLMAVRESAPKKSMLRDLCDCVAHDVRDRPGTYAHRYITRLIKRLRAMSRRDAPVLVESFFPISDLITELLAIADAEGVNRWAEDLDTVYEERKLRAQGSHLATQIAMALNGTTFKIAGASAIARWSQSDGPRLEIAVREPGLELATFSFPMLNVSAEPTFIPSGWSGRTATARGLATFLNRR